MPVRFFFISSFLKKLVLEKLAEEYEQKLKLMAKQMSAQIEEKEHSFNQQLIDFIGKFLEKEILFF